MSLSIAVSTSVLSDLMRSDAEATMRIDHGMMSRSIAFKCAVYLLNCERKKHLPLTLQMPFCHLLFRELGWNDSVRTNVSGVPVTFKLEPLLGNSELGTMETIW